MTTTLSVVGIPGSSDVSMLELFSKKSTSISPGQTPHNKPRKQESHNLILQELA
jgi:hypothetical protein